MTYKTSLHDALYRHVEENVNPGLVIAEPGKSNLHFLSGTVVRFLPYFCIEILDKIFDGQNISSDKIFDTKLKFRHFCPTNFCPITYVKIKSLTSLSPKFRHNDIKIKWKIKFQKILNLTVLPLVGKKSWFSPIFVYNLLIAFSYLKLLVFYYLHMLCILAKFCGFFFIFGWYTVKSRV